MIGLNLVRKADFDVVDVDLIFGIPGQTDEILIEDINTASSVGQPRFPLTLSLTLLLQIIIINLCLKRAKADAAGSFCSCRA